MPFQVRKGSLMIIARTPADAVTIFDGLHESHIDDDPVIVLDMSDGPVDVEQLRAQAKDLDSA